MYKSTSASMQHRVNEMSFGDISNAAFAVVCFRERRDNQRRKRTFRFIETFRRRVTAEKYFNRINAPCKIFIAGLEIVETSGDASFVDNWRAEKTSWHQNADPIFSVSCCGRWVKYTNLSPSYL
ncbi:hypothetical protein KKB41_04010 [Patescibacteria group bacterium]|nr:hypothetical protein [Patescibacteria group bacterium]